MSAQDSLQARFLAFYASLGLSEREFAKKVGVSNGFIQSVKSGTSFSVDILSKILSSFPELNSNWLVHGKGSMLFIPEKKPLDDSVMKNYDEVNTAIGRIIKAQTPTVITVDSRGIENIVLVPYKAQAGYIRGVKDPDYIDQLPAFSLPKFRNGIFRAFEVEGYSMLNEEGIGLHPTDYVIGRYVERLDEIRDNRVYILVNSAQGLDDIIIKRCYNTIKEYGWLLCKSDNLSGEYPDIHLDPQHIKEVWEWKGFLSSYYPRTSDIYNRMNELEKQVANLNQQLKLIKQ